MTDQRSKWNDRYTDAGRNCRLNQPALVVSQHVHLLPSSGRALDLACGFGANALFLARQGLTVVAWDISDVAIDRLQKQARLHSLTIQAQVRDVIKNPPQMASFDIIVVSHFLDRNMVPSLIEALRPGGLIFYQTFIQDKVTEAGPSNPDYLLQTNELLTMFSGLIVLSYREEGRVGDISKGFRNEAMMVARNP